MSAPCNAGTLLFGPGMVVVGLLMIYAGIQAWRNPDSYLVQSMIDTAFVPDNDDASPFAKAVGFTRENVSAMRLFSLRSIMPFGGVVVTIIGAFKLFTDLHLGCKL